MTVPLPLFELIEADGDVNQITDIRLTLCLLNLEQIFARIGGFENFAFLFD